MELGEWHYQYFELEDIFSIAPCHYIRPLIWREAAINRRWVEEFI